jgi:archaetidylinositol phosphate synthase
MDEPTFAGAFKENDSVLTPLERRLAPWVLPRIPAWIQTHHLTWLTIVWCAGILAFSRAAAADRRWLWAVSLMVLLQWATDHFDGKLGKFRGTGLVRWGFYMDHLLDYAFICSILIGWSFVLPDSSSRDVLALMAVCGGFVAHTVLVFATTGTFRISLLRMGPTELRVAVVVINALIVKYGTGRMVAVLPYAAAGGLVLLGVAVAATHRRLWAMDLAAKREEAAATAASSVRR